MLGFDPLSGGALSTLSPPAAAMPGVFGVLGTVGCATGCSCAGNCTQRFIPYVCGNFTSCFVVGSLVSVYTSMGGTLIASGTTNSLGSVTLNIGVTGSYYVTATAPGYPNYAATRTLVCGGSTSLSLPPAGPYYACCTCCALILALPASSQKLIPMYLSDANGTYQLQQAVDNHGNQALLCSAPFATANLGTCGPPCSIGNSGTGYVLYMVYCAAVGGVGALQVTRYWSLFYCPCSCIPPLSAAAYGIFTGDINGLNDPSAPSSTGCAFARSTITSVISACGTLFSWSGTPATVGTPAISDPVGGSVAITA
jgi:hypothetical protein